MTTVKKLKYQKEVALVIAHLDEVSNAEQNWKVEYDRTNKTLYSLLAACLEIYNTIKAKPIEKEALAAIKEELVKRGDTFNKKTKILTLIVRYVFKTQHNRAFIYSRALGIAVKEPVTPDRFSDWVTASGGIEEVVAKAINPKTKAKQVKLANKVIEAKNYLEAQAANPLAIVNPDAFIANAGDGVYTIFLAKTDAGHISKILCSVPNASDAMVDNCISKIAAEMIEKGMSCVTNTETIDSGFKFYQLPLGAVDEATNAANDELSEREAMIAQRDALFQFSE